MHITSLTPSNRQKFLEDNKDKFVIVVFDAEFTGQQDIVQKASEALVEFSKSNSNVQLASADVEENNDFATEQSILSVPVVLLIGPDGKTKKKIDTLETGKLIKLLEEELVKHQKLFPQQSATATTGDTQQQEDGRHSANNNHTTTNRETDFKGYLKYLTNRAPVMVFMKGDPSAPRCGFSKQLTAILAKHGIEYQSFDILEDEQVRQGLKDYSDWPTYPQIYVKGEFVGGLDTLKMMEESGELQSTLTP